MEYLKNISIYLNKVKSDIDDEDIFCAIDDILINISQIAAIETEYTGNYYLLIILKGGIEKRINKKFSSKRKAFEYFIQKLESVTSIKL